MEHLGATLLSCVHTRVSYCDQKQLEDRWRVFHELQDLLQAWVLESGKKKEVLNESLLQKHGARLLAFGSQKLGVVGKDSDIDAVAIVPKLVQRDMFFARFPAVLQNNPEVKQLRVIQAAYVPVIKLAFREIQFDLCLARLQMDCIPENLDILSADILRGLDEESIRSLNGPKETQRIAELVPDFELFVHVLKVVKFWAKSKGLYSSSMGFLGGIGWTLSVAYCCQNNPKSSLTKLLRQFFHTMATWPWPQPLMIAPLEEDPLNLKTWNPKLYTGDLHHVMPIITPVYPQHNCAFTVMQSTKAVINKHLLQACEVMDDIMEERTETTSLFDAAPFVREYKHFLLVTSTAKSYQEHVDWSGLVEAKLRLLVSSLEKQQSISLAHPCNKTFLPLVPQADAFQSLWLVGLQFHQTSGLNLNLTEDVHKFNEALARAGLVRFHAFDKTRMTIQVKHVKRKQLHNFIAEDDLV